MDISIDQLLQLIGEEHVKAVLLAKQVEQLRQLIEELKRENASGKEKGQKQSHKTLG